MVDLNPWIVSIKFNTAVKQMCVKWEVNCLLRFDIWLEALNIYKGRSFKYYSKLARILSPAVLTNGK